MNIQTKINKIILHCSATPEGKDYKMSDIDRWHKNQGWEMCGYHFIVDLDGTIEKGRDEKYVGAHCSGQNTNSIGICYIGGCDKNMKAKDTRTEAQKISLYKLVNELMVKYNLTLTNVYGHRDFSSKECPCFLTKDFRKEYENYYSQKKYCPYCGKNIQLE